MATARLLILGVLCFLLGLALLLTSFLASQILIYQRKKVEDYFLLISIQSGILQVSGGLLILTSVFVLSYYLWGSKKTKKSPHSEISRRKRKPLEISRVHYG
jgi:uncharacterized BrkB/YihY/UPF0761 family membrane protein